MTHNWLTIIAAIVLVLVGAGSALAEGAATVPLRLSGQGVVVRGDPPQLLVSADGSGWRLDLTMTPARSQPSGAGQQALALVGTYQLSGPKVSTITGQVTGQLSPAGVGQIELANPSDAVMKFGATPLTAAFTIGQSSTIQVTLSGSLPTPPPPPSTAPINHTFWYISRAAGFTAYGLLTLTVAFGLLVHTKLMDAIVARWQTFDLHQFTALLALAFVGLHVFALLGDQYIGFDLAQLFLPLVSPYRPVQVALGIVAMYLLVVIVGSFYVRRQITYARWRAIHYLTFGVFLLALGHGALAGTDSGQLWAVAIYWGTGAVILALTYWRLQHEPGQARSEPDPLPVASPAARARR